MCYGLLALTLLCATAHPGPAKAAERLLIFAAASLQGTIGDIALRFEKKTGVKVAVSLASSSRLARQIQQGARADVYLSANEEWMDTLDRGKHLRPNTRSDLIGNRLVLVAPQDHARPVRIKRQFPLAQLLGDQRLAMADPTSVPAGEYAKASLESLDVWDTVAKQVAGTSNVRVALALVARGEAPYGIVYRTDAMAARNVTVVGVFPEDSHPPIVYPVAIPAGSTHPHAGEFVTFLRSPAAAKVFMAHGFTILER